MNRERQKCTEKNRKTERQKLIEKDRYEKRNTE